MILRHGERILLQGMAIWNPGAVRSPGTLLLTNLRIVFEVSGPSPYTAVDIDLARVWNVHIGRTEGMFSGRRETLVLETHAGRITFEASEANRWATTIVSAKQATPPPPPPGIPPPPGPSPGGPSPAGSTPPVVVNVHPAAAPKVLTRCRYCGNVYDLASGRCDKCGAVP